MILSALIAMKEFGTAKAHAALRYLSGNQCDMSGALVSEVALTFSPKAAL